MSVTTILLLVGVTGIFAGIFLSLTAVGVFTNEVRGISKSLAVVEAFTAAPQAMRDELEPGFQDRVLGPFMDRFVNLGKRLTPSGYSERILQKLNIAGNPPGWTVDRVLSLKALGIGVGLLLGIVFAVLLAKPFGFVLAAGAVGGALGYYGPNLYLYQKGYDRTN